MSIKTGIYKIENLVSGTVYIGSTADSFRGRWGDHKSGLRRGGHYNSYLQNAWNKYGEDTFSFSVIEEIENVDKLILREQLWLDVYRMYGKVYNQRLNVDPCARGRKHSEESKIKMSIAHKGRKHSKKHTRNAALSRSRNHPSFKNLMTEDKIPAGRNFAETCRMFGLNNSALTAVKFGKVRSYRGWVLADSDWKLEEIGTSACPKYYPAFRHEVTGETIPAGENLKAICDKLGLRHTCMWRVVHGERKTHKGWRLLNV